ncbi:MAG: chemotaxis protein CheA [Phycisphaerales bacterium]|nr:chemotaxis protein CheA [Phycisphaerales bacterium]
MTNQLRNQNYTVDQVRAALSQFSDHCAQRPDQNHLGLLAQMHSCCEILQAPPDDVAEPEARAALARLARAVGTFVEKVILDEAADIATGLALFPSALAAFGAILDQNQTTAADELEPKFRRCAGLDSAAPRKIAPAAPGMAPPPVAKPAPVAAQPKAEDDAYVSEPLILDMDEREHLTGFVDEAREHMDAIEAALLDVERDPTDLSKINELFRPIHTIKGIAGFLNLRDINRTAHEVETILDLARRAELNITPTTVDLFFAACDALKQQIASIAGYLGTPDGKPVPQPEITGLIGRLRLAAAGQLVESDGRQSAKGAASSDEPAAAPATPGAAPHPESAAQSESAKQSADASLRIDTAKLDQLIDWVGELVIAQTMVNLNQVVRTDEGLTRNVTHVAKIVREIQECAMSMRMVPIGPTFQKMKRLVRDVGRKAGKDVELRIDGEETELDKTVIQQISDPLVHMVRNSVDHGIEPPEDRRKVGKSEQGTVALDAYHQGDSIVIEIRDDGRGLNRAKLLAKGIERGLVSANDQLTDQQVYSLIMEAGFSTAEKITDISGRGVGMDVVRRNVEQLRGKIEIQSEEGKGTTFLIRLPLTLAIIDGMLVRVGSERLIIPTIMIERSLRPTPDQIHLVQRHGEMLMVRGELYPIVGLGPLFGYTDHVNPCESLVVICQCEGQKMGLVVDELIGQQQVVIKTLGERFKQIRGVSGAAILGDGRVGLILEPTGLLRLHNSHQAGAAKGGARSGGNDGVRLISSLAANEEQLSTVG